MSKARRQMSKEEIPAIKMRREPALAKYTHGWIAKAFRLRGFVWNKSIRYKHNLKVRT